MLKEPLLHEPYHHWQQKSTSQQPLLGEFKHLVIVNVAVAIQVVLTTLTFNSINCRQLASEKEAIIGSNLPTRAAYPARTPAITFPRPYPRLRL